MKTTGSPRRDDTIHVFIGTKAQYIKTAPLMRLMDRREVEYRLVDSGQHAALSERLRQELDVPVPDRSFGTGRDVASIRAAMAWAVRVGRHVLRSRAAVRRDVFGSRGGVCVIHGDTPTTLITALLARRAGLTIAHLEAGLRSHHLLHPFPEEIVRLLVMRMADLLFAPHAEASRNLADMDIGGRIVSLSANTTIEALRHALDGLSVRRDGPAVVTCHRVENLRRRRRLRRLVQIVEEIAARHSVQFVAHGPTMASLRADDLDDRLRGAGVELLPLLSHSEFVRRLSRARFVITDGGSIQEECYYLGVPTLLWRKWTERPEGLDRNVVLSGYDGPRVQAFLGSIEDHRHPPLDDRVEPSVEILERLLEEVASSSGRSRGVATP